MEITSTKETVKEDIKSLLVVINKLCNAGKIKPHITTIIPTYVEINFNIIQEVFDTKTYEKDLVPAKNLISIRDLSKYIGNICQELKMDPYCFDLVLETFLAVCYNQCPTVIIGYPTVFIKPDENHVRLHNDRPSRPIEEVLFHIRTTCDTITLYHGNMLIGYIYSIADKAIAIYVNDRIYLGTEYPIDTKQFISHYTIGNKDMNYADMISKVERTVQALKWLIQKTFNT